LKVHSFELKIIVINFIPLQADVFQFAQKGVSGFILKEANIVEFFSVTSVLLPKGSFVGQCCQVNNIIPPPFTAEVKINNKDWGLSPTLCLMGG
jgi:hypothetical protein